MNCQLKLALLLPIVASLSLAGCDNGPPPPKGRKVTRTLILDEAIVRDVVAGAVVREHLAPGNTDARPVVEVVHGQECSNRGGCSEIVREVRVSWTTKVGTIATSFPQRIAVRLIRQELVDRGVTAPISVDPWQDSDSNYEWMVVGDSTSSLDLEWQEMANTFKSMP